MQKLLKKNNTTALSRFISMYSLFVSMGIGIVWSWNHSTILLIVFLLIFGMLVCSLFACQHECVHNTAFKSPQLNRIIAFITGLSYIYPSSIFRELHFTHHRHTHEPGLDPEISLGGKAIPSVVSSLPFYLTWLSGFPLFMFKLGMTIVGALGMPEFMRKNVYPFIRPEVRLKIVLESWAILMVQLSIVGLALFVNNGFWGLFVGLLIGHCMLASYTAAEHNGLPHEGSILEKTRSIAAPSFVKFLMWNMPYHAEHHAYPAVPFHALPLLHQEMKDELKHKDQNHPKFHWMVFKNTTIGK
ncbi:fatty acid desaturase [Aureispira sp. CCB-E]|nr:fatty acid desaturase [Aureispira sp. CCB-E]WMX13889.1 fatty acid desaturase [Aureispira sp. CCB-E]